MTRMHVSGGVGQWHSTDESSLNKIEQSMAESEEGRPLIKEENILQSSTRLTQSGASRVTGRMRVCGKRFLIAFAANYPR